eukprot:scaffold12684_cov45-Cyclotella_meneghiniana.AAC.7
MIEENIEAYCAQETWEADDYIKTVRGYLVIHHNISKETWNNKNSSEKRGGVRKGVAIILSPRFSKAYAAAGSPQPITTPQDSRFVGRFIGVTLLFPSINPKGKCIRNKPTKIFLSSIYHPSQNAKEKKKEYLQR